MIGDQKKLDLRALYNSKFNLNSLRKSKSRVDRLVTDNPLPRMPVLGSSNSAVNKDMM